MKIMFARHRVKPDSVAEHELLITAISRELAEKAPQDVSSLVLKLEDGSYLYLLGCAGSPDAFFAFDSFRAFQSGAEARLLEPPQRGEARLLHAYRAFGA